jgi:uracil-DNA glycosylase family 4
MGFFLDETQVVVETQKRQGPRPKKEGINIASHPKGCDACPLSEVWNRISTPKMPMSGNLDGDILVLAEGPGEEEDTKGEVLIGKTGKFLREQFPFKDVDRLAYTNAVRCRPPGNRTPTGLEMHCCSEHLELDISKSNFKAVLIVGGAALSRFIPEAVITQIHGIWFPIEIGGKLLWAFPVFHPSFVERSGGDRSPNYPCFRADIKRFFKEVDKRKKPEIPHPSADDVICINREEDARELYKELRGIIGIDLETAKITKEKVGAVLKPRERGARIITAALSDGDVTFAFPVEHPSDPNNWAARFLLEVTQERQWVAHQSSFEFKWLLEYSKRLDFPWKCHAFDDSMAIARLHHNREVLLGLDVVSHILLGVDIKKLTHVEPRRIMDFPLEEVLPYNGLDSWASAKIIRLNREVNAYNYQHIIRAERSFSYMEIAGVPIDLEVARELKAKWGKIAEEKEKEAQTIYEAKQFMRERQQEFNLGNPDHVGRALVDYGRVELPKTPSGKSYSTDDSVLEPVADKNPLARLALDYREATKHVSTYVDPILRAPERFEDSTIHGGYTSMRTATLRSSGEDPNMQNFPKRRHRELRKSIAARPGHLILACDSGQIQARVFGCASRDSALCQSFIDHVDIHSHWLNRALEIHPEYIDHLARETNEKDEKKIRKAGRDTIKSDFVFASFFGSTAESCADRTGIPLRKTRELLEEFWGSYPDALKWLQARRAEYKDTGGVTTLTGRFRYGVMSGNEPIITPIQGGEAEIIIGAQNDLSEKAIERDDFYLHPRVNVHDDLSFEIPNDDDKIEYYIREIAHEMTRIRFPWQIVPLTVECKIGPNWCDLEEICVIEGDYIR